jgi:hypothetical protein
MRIDGPKLTDELSEAGEGEPGASAVPSGDGAILGLPGGGAMLSESETRHREFALTSGRPLAVFTIPSTGREIAIYPKPQGYFYRIEQATNDYLDALIHYARTRQPIRRWRIFKRAFRMGRQMRAIENLRTKMYVLLSMILADKYNPERHFEITVDEFDSIPHDLLVSILDAFRKGNSIDDILEKLIPNWGQSELKKKIQESGAGHAFTAR